MNKINLTIEALCQEAKLFKEIESIYPEPTLYGITDGKAIGTYLEHKFKAFLSSQYSFEHGNSAVGIDFPELEIDIKVTSIKQPQSSCPFKTAKQKIYGLGYSLLIFVYEKNDNSETKSSVLNIRHTVFVSKDKTADFQITSGLLNIINNEGNLDDVIAFIQDKNLPIDEIEINKLAQEVLLHPPKLGYLTISNAFQWRLQYSRVIEKANQVEGIIRL